MRNGSTILIPVDFSGHSRAAARRGCEFAVASDATLHLVHARPPKPDDGSRAEEGAEDAGRDPASVRALAQLADELAPRGARLLVRLEQDEPVAMIRDWVAADRADLVIVGAHDFDPPGRVFAGSVSERTLHACAAPLMIVKENEAEAGQPVRRILFPTDFSDASHAALELAIEWARLLEADIEVFHAVAEGRPAYADQPEWTAAELGMAGRRDRALDRLQALLSRLRDRGVRAGAELSYGPPSLEIVKRAQRSRAQVVVMGRCGRSAGSPGRFGGVAEQVLKHVKCSVLFGGRSPASA